jgi:hypothetical protein
MIKEINEALNFVEIIDMIEKAKKPFALSK